MWWRSVPSEQALSHDVLPGVRVRRCWWRSVPSEQALSNSVLPGVCVCVCVSGDCGGVWFPLSRHCRTVCCQGGMPCGWSWFCYLCGRHCHTVRCQGWLLGVGPQAELLHGSCPRPVWNLRGSLLHGWRLSWMRRPAPLPLGLRAPFLSSSRSSSRGSWAGGGSRGFTEAPHPSRVQYCAASGLGLDPGALLVHCHGVLPTVLQSPYT